VGEISVRSATVEDAEQLAALKWEWSRLEPRSQFERQEFAELLGRWLANSDERRVCLVAEDPEAGIVGMAWVVLFERAPNPDARDRWSADLQSVFVRPEFRRIGAGRRLVDAAVREAAARGASRLLVSANDEVLSLYQRAGFSATPLLLEIELSRD
jgi:ribosomal protein S18 acetylase RimI-like enzyme